MKKIDTTEYLFKYNHVLYKNILFDNCAENNCKSLVNTSQCCLRLSLPVFIDVNKCNFVFKSSYNNSRIWRVAKCLLAPFKILSLIFPFNKIYISILNKKKAKEISKRLEIAKAVSSANKDIKREFDRTVKRIIYLLNNSSCGFEEKKRRYVNYILHQKQFEIKRSQLCFTNLIVIAVDYNF